MRLITLFFLSTPVFALAQPTVEMVRIRGQLMSPDSIPVENAYLISYITLRAFATNEKGYFDVIIHKYDSLKIHHVSYKAVILNGSNITSDTTIILDYELNLIEDIEVNDLATMAKHFNMNKTTMKNEFLILKKLNYRNRTVQNPYTNNQFTNTSGMSLGDIIGLFKKKKK